MIEDTTVIRNRFLVKEKMVREVMRVDSRQGSSFFSAVRKEYEKEKNVLAVKLYLVCKLAQVFQPGGTPMSPDDIIRVGVVLGDIAGKQAAKLDELFASNRRRSLIAVFQDPASAFDVKDAIKEYMGTKDLVKKQVTAFILKHRGAIIKTRAAADVEYMIKSGQVPAPADKQAKEELLKCQEEQILLETVYAELLKKTSRMENAVNRLVDWRTRVASAPAGSLGPAQVDSEKKALMLDFLEAIEEVKAKALENSAAGGIFNSPDAVSMLTNLKSNLSEQQTRAGHVVNFLNTLKAQGVSGAAVHQVDGSALSQAGCDRIDELMKEERNVYIDIRRMEPEPGQFFETLSSVVSFNDKS